MTRVFLILALTLLSACAPRGEVTLAPEAAGLGEIEPIFVGSSRKIEGGEFTRGRSDQTSFVRYDVSVPPNREVGEVNWPPRYRKPDGKRDFVTLAEQVYPSSEPFRRDLTSAIKVAGERDVVVYVHGFNNTLAEGVYRVAQLNHDLQVPGVAIHYAWPSRASALAYVYDRDSAIFARDGLESLLKEVSASGADSITLVAHSMGSVVTMETLRQLALQKDRSVLPRLAGVVLLSPDIDVDVFHGQAAAIGKLPQPFLIFGNTQDRILDISARLAGEPQRLGNLTDLTRIADLDVTYLDTAAFSEGSGHFNVGTSPALVKLLNGIGNIESAFRGDDTARVGLLPGIVLTVQSATKIVLLPVSTVAEQVSARETPQRFRK